ncbi:unnamed protein product [Anisakis simplex]|uniref:Ovule protein n=1 Tax=Anisakis simplex TaxID=6269 RepID=A0A0M3JJK8_ANISI|nr:unnamed protein product [Anisakis simplex]
MQSGNTTASDIFGNCDHANSSVGTVPAGSRLAQYLQPPLPRHSSWNTPLSQPQTANAPYGLSSQAGMPPSTVRSFITNVIISSLN